MLGYEELFEVWESFLLPLKQQTFNFRLHPPFTLISSKNEPFSFPLGCVKPYNQVVTARSSLPFKTEVSKS